MLIHNLNRRIIETEISSYNETDYFFIVADIEEMDDRTAGILRVALYPENAYRRIDEGIKYEVNEDYDFIGFIFLKQRDEQCHFEKINIYHGRNFVLLLLDLKRNSFEHIIDNLKIGQSRTISGKKDLVGLFYRFLSGVISDMFDSLNRYEELLMNIEDELLKGIGDGDFEKIVEAKGTSFAIKKNLRFLLHISDQIVDDENDLIPMKSAKYFKNLDARINRLYGFSEGLHEMTEHLMNLYDSTVTSRTNRLLNKLTTVTIFATPLTVITGIYGMNFVNMPELQKEYGYFAILGIMVLCLGATYLVLKRMKVI